MDAIQSLNVTLRLCISYLVQFPVVAVEWGVGHMHECRMVGTGSGVWGGHVHECRMAGTGSDRLEFRFSLCCLCLSVGADAYWIPRGKCVC